MAPADNPALRRGKLRTVVGRDLRSRFLAALGVVRSLRITEAYQKKPREGGEPRAGLTFMKPLPLCRGA